MGLLVGIFVKKLLLRAWLSALIRELNRGHSCREQPKKAIKGHSPVHAQLHLLFIVGHNLVNIGEPESHLLAQFPSQRRTDHTSA